ncbi:MAG: hypothetical protein JXK05_10930 [Campylobacterales bacterium]|nr:hypothetical protein [Campylobacterales bacterium]
MRRIGLYWIAIVLLQGCAQKVSIRALEPAAVDRAAMIKTVVVSRFGSDSVDLSGKIEVALSRQKVEGEPFFRVLGRKDLETILQEQRYQHSGLMDPSTAVEAGRLIGAQAIISGTLSRPSLQDTTYYEKRSECIDKGCNKMRNYEVRCTKRVSALSAQIRMVDVREGDIIYGETLSRSGEWSQCMDESAALPSKEMAAQQFAQEIAQTFVAKLTPSYRIFEVELLESPDLDYSSAQKKLHQDALAYIEHGRYDRAQELLSDLIESTMRRSYVAFYNLGVVKEAQGAYDEAKSYYIQADRLSGRPIEQISVAVLRIDRVIENRHKTLSQMER